MGRIPHRLPFRYCEPAFFGGLLDDPLLFLRIRPEGRALLFDCGQIAHLSKRVVKPIDAVFITHAHMDHIMGIPTLVRHHHASPLPLDIFGPPGITDRIDHLLHGYDWNLCEPTWFTIRVHEVHEDRIRQSRFPGPECFVRRDEGETLRTNRIIWSSRYLEVEAEILDHKIPVLAFRATERPAFTIDPVRLEAMGLLPGDWIRDLKTRVWKGRGDAPIVALLKDGGEQIIDDPNRLYEALRGEHQTASIGYVTDVGWTPDNLERMDKLLAGVTLLCAECTFLAADRDKARVSYHLCADDLNKLAGRLAPGYLLPMHLSKSYLYRTFDLYEELHPPAGTGVIRLPNHLVPPPLTVEDVKGWLHP